jgi:hypothetical protein
MDRGANDATLDALMSLNRRRFLKLGVGAAAVLALAGGSIALLSPGMSQGRLTDAGRDVFAAIARGVLDGCLPEDTAQRKKALHEHMLRLDDTLAGFPPAVQSELSQLLAILASPPGRAIFAGLQSPWAQASVAQLQSALQSMRTSSLALRQQAYHALRDLTNAAYFADPQAWALLGYPGPREL